MIKKKLCALIFSLLMVCSLSSACGESERTAKLQTNLLQETPQTEQGKTHSYIGNKNSGKLHYPHCTSVKQMKEGNKAYLNCTQKDAVSKGYDPCKKCNP